MRKVGLIGLAVATAVFLAIGFLGGGGGDASSFEDALKLAESSNKPVLVDLYVPF